MSWCGFKTAYLLDENYPNLSDGVANDWIWEAMNHETFPVGWHFTGTDVSGAAGFVLVFEIDKTPRTLDCNVVEAVLQMMERKHKRK